MTKQTVNSEPGLVALTGATGYIGGRLAVRLLEAGYRVRCLVRSPRKLNDRPWVSDKRVEVVQNNIEDSAETALALQGCDVAFYLIHSMIAAGGAFAKSDRALAESFSRASAQAGVSRIVYLGGMSDTGPDLSEHLRSRVEVERALSSSGVSVTTLRAAMIIGSGSASFEILRYLVERLPVMITPWWVSSVSQPIAITNVLDYLVDCLRIPATKGLTIDIGGADAISYHELMQIMASELGLRRRLIIPVPVLTPRLSSLWIHFVTPVPSEIARPLAEGLRHTLVVSDDTAQRLMPQHLLSAREAIHQALQQHRENEVETVWSASGSMTGDPDWSGGAIFVDERSVEVAASAEDVYSAVIRIGGGHGWYAADWMWRIRGAMDRLVGGPGLRRGRRNSETIAYGEALDFWRVIAADAPRHLLLLAEMKLPGEAWLEFRVESTGHGTRLIQTARFRPRGLAGLAYWYAVKPLHNVVFRGMLTGIRHEAERRTRSN